MISLALLADIRRLYFAEHWKIGTIADQLKLHPDTVRRALETERFNHWRGRAAPRVTMLDPYLPFLRDTLAQYPRLRATRLYEMLRGRGYPGSVVQLRRVVRSLRPPRREAFLRLTTLPGEQAQADWAHFGQIHLNDAHWTGDAVAFLLRLDAVLLARLVVRILPRPVAGKLAAGACACVCRVGRRTARDSLRQSQERRHDAQR